MIMSTCVSGLLFSTSLASPRNLEFQLRVGLGFGSLMVLHRRTATLQTVNVQGFGSIEGRVEVLKEM